MPVATLNRIEADDFSWLVPGLREELVTELIRSLPKNLRVAMVPAPNTAREFLAATPPGAEPLLDAPRALRPQHPQPRHPARGVGLVQGPRAPAADLPGGRPRSGAEAGRGKDLDALKEPLRPTFEQAMADVAADSGVTATGQTAWTFGTIEESFVQRRAGHEVRGFPALVDEGGDGRPAGARHRPTRPRRTTASAYAVSCCSRSARPTPVDEVLAAAGLDQRAKLALVGSPYPSVGRPARRLRAGVVGEVVDAAARRA